MTKNDDKRNCFDSAKIAAARFVDYQMRSAHEVRQRLMRGGFGADVVQAVIEMFEAQGLLDDTAFALAFIQDKLRIAKHGRFRITHGLRAKGVCAEAIAIAFGKIEESPLDYIDADSLDEAELENAASLISQKYRGAEFDTDTFKKAAAFLARRGYSRDIIKKAVLTGG